MKRIILTNSKNHRILLMEKVRDKFIFVSADIVRLLVCHTR